MKALVYVAPEKLELQDYPIPEARETEVLIRVRKTGICGSDLSGYLGHHARRKPPLVLGHEFVGEVVNLGPAVKRVRKGQRVVIYPILTCGRCLPCISGRHNLCRSWKLLGMDLHGSLMEYIAVPQDCCYVVESERDDATIVWTEPVANAVHMVAMAGVTIFDKVLIVGCGPIGLSILYVLQLAGMGEIAACDCDSSRMAMAKEVGATKVWDANNPSLQEEVMNWTDLYGVDLAIEAVGTSSTRNLAGELCRAGGTVLHVGLHDDSSTYHFNNMVRKELHLQGSIGYTKADFQRALCLVERQGIPFSQWTHEFPLERGVKAFELLRNPPSNVLKILVGPPES